MSYYRKQFLNTRNRLELKRLRRKYGHISDGFLSATLDAIIEKIEPLSCGAEWQDDLAIMADVSEKETPLYKKWLLDAIEFEVFMFDGNNLFSAYIKKECERINGTKQRSVAGGKARQKQALENFGSASGSASGSGKKRREEKRREEKKKSAYALQKESEISNSEIPNHLRSGGERRISELSKYVIDPDDPESSKVWLTKTEVKSLIKKFGFKAELDYLADELSSLADNKPAKFRTYKNHNRTLQNWRKLKHEKGLEFFIHPTRGPGYYKLYEIEKAAQLLGEI